MKQPQHGYKKRGIDREVPAVRPTLPREYYQAEAIYQEELEKIFYKRWLLVCREEEIPEPGHFLTVPVGDESILLVRDEQGQIHAHFNVCRHRGTRICMEERGQFDADLIRCPYHAWQYELNGRLKAAPLMKDAPGFRMADYPLYAARVRVWGGFVFINLVEDPVAFEEEMDALIGRFEDWKLSELRIVHQLNYTLACNWKLILQNYQECYHFHYYSIFPNVLFTPHPDFVLYHRIRPVAVNQSRNDCFFLLHPDVIKEPKRMARFQSAIEFWDMTNRQDGHVCEQMQRGLKAQRFGRGRFMPQEDILYALDREVLKALGHGVAE